VHLCTPTSNHQPNTSADKKAHKITPGLEIIRDITPHFMRQRTTKHERKKESSPTQTSFFHTWHASLFCLHVQSSIGKEATKAIKYACALPGHVSILRPTSGTKHLHLTLFASNNMNMKKRPQLWGPNSKPQNYKPMHKANLSL
jgi:hypothetical protein